MIKENTNNINDIPKKITPTKKEIAQIEPNNNSMLILFVILMLAKNRFFCWWNLYILNKKNFFEKN